MGTRCCVTVVDRRGERRKIYRHWDGYPESAAGVLAGIEDAKKYAWPEPRFEASDFAAALIRAWKTEGGGNINVCSFDHEHGDLDFDYTIGPDKEGGELVVTIVDVWSERKGDLKRVSIPLWDNLLEESRTFRFST